MSVFMCMLKKEGVYVCVCVCVCVCKCVSKWRNKLFILPTKRHNANAVQERIDLLNQYWIRIYRNDYLFIVILV